MNRSFYSEEEKQGKLLCYEVELLTEYMKKNLQRDNIRMFLDIHAHSTESSIFIYSP